MPHGQRRPPEGRRGQRLRGGRRSGARTDLGVRLVLGAPGGAIRV